MEKTHRLIPATVLSVFLMVPAAGEQSVARRWNEALLDAIRVDTPRPTVHARNLFHVSLAMYDAWAVYDDVADTYFLGKTVGGYPCAFTGVPAVADVESARQEAISYAAYRLLMHRFSNSPAATQSLGRFRSLMLELGYDPSFTSMNYATGSPATLGNYLGQCLIDLGLHDGSNEQINYAYRHYVPVNPPLFPARPGNSTILDLNRWQPLSLIAADGSISTPKFLCPEWCWVCPFSLTEQDRTVHVRDGLEYWVYHDPGMPPCLCTPGTGDPLAESYRWGFVLTAIWSSHLDPTDNALWDISPASLGNIQALPRTAGELAEFYGLFEGGDSGAGRPVNPRTGKPYEPQIVPRGDYTRVLAEFWADGPNSETPPGHWFTILNHVSDAPAFVKRFRGVGPVVDPLEWDVKAYLALGGAVHDAAVATWSIKGWYDFVRPISAIRGMAARGQASSPNQAGYDPAGIPLVPGFIEIVKSGDPLAGPTGANAGKIKMRAWRGPASIENPQTDVAGVGWILAENWWPYQRPSFVTPAFAGYISGHSTFSRAAAEVLTLLTGDEYFPGGLGEFHAPKNTYLVFEDGPSVDVTLQWATYRDAADQSGLSRIWGGIHVPMDDVPGRIIGAGRHGCLPLCGTPLPGPYETSPLGQLRQISGTGGFETRPYRHPLPRRTRSPRKCG